jgi:hypothetical protein
VNLVVYVGGEYCRLFPLQISHFQVKILILFHFIVVQIDSYFISLWFRLILSLSLVTTFSLLDVHKNVHLLFSCSVT